MSLVEVLLFVMLWPLSLLWFVVWHIPGWLWLLAGAIAGLGLLVYIRFIACTGILNGLGWIFKVCYRRARHRHAGGSRPQQA